jgi:hypothetical protein
MFIHPYPDAVAASSGDEDAGKMFKMFRFSCRGKPEHLDGT